MSRTALDTSVLVAALQTWHTEHDRALEAVARVLESPPIVLPLHVLLETYSVLTRMPKSVRLSPQDALTLLDRTLRGKADVASPDGATAFTFLERLRDHGIVGGATYDAAIAHLAFEAGARSLLTLNRRHFERVAPDGLEIVEP